MLVLADEAPDAAFRSMAWIEAGVSLCKAERYRFAIDQLERGLAIEPDNLPALREKGTCLQRLAQAGEPGYSLDLALQHYDSILASHPTDAETWALAGRVHKNALQACWRDGDDPPDRQRDKALDSVDALLEAQERYIRGFRANPSHYYSGINVLTLQHLARHLGVEAQSEEAQRTLAGAVRFAAESENERATSFWYLTTLADLAVLEGSSDQVVAAYRRAIAQRDTDRFALASCRTNLLLLQELGFRPDVVAAAIAILDRGIARIAPAQELWRPRMAILFSGNMIDTPDRSEPRSPPAKEAAALERIEKALADLNAGEQDIAFAQAAAGGDLLFLEACQRRQVCCQVLLPFEEPTFLQKSVLASHDGELWRDRYYTMKDRLTLPLRIMPQELGAGPMERNPYERCNFWLLYTALACGIQRVRFICLWNGQQGDGIGDAAHLHEEMMRRIGHIQWIDTRSLPSI